MSNAGEVLTITPPDVEEAIREAVAAERNKLDAWSERHKKAIDKVRDGRLKQLDLATDILNSKLQGESVPKQSDNKTKRSGRRRYSTRAQIEARRQAIYRFLVEQGKPVACSEIARTLNLTHSQTLRALTRLIKDNMVLRTGENSTIKYEVRSGVPAEVSRKSRSAPADLDPIDDRLRRSIERRGMATPDELAREFRMPFEQVQRGCGALIRKDIVALRVREGRRVYVPLEAAA